jgi:PPOX class probable F420-dependent enzyme
MTRRSIDELGDLLELPYCAVLSTHREDGSVLLSPVWHEWRDGGFTIGIPEDGINMRNIARDPRISIVVYDHAWPARGVEVRGIAQIRPDLREGLSLRMAIRYLGPTAGAVYAAGVEPGVTIRLEGTIRAWDYIDEVRPEPGAGIPTPVAPTNRT